MDKIISWVEIPAANFERAVEFYSTILNINLQIINGNEEKMACFPSGEGAISYAPGFNPGTDGTLVSLNAADKLEQTLSAITQNGGAVIQPKTKIEAEGRGYFAIFMDSEGNKVGLYGNQ